MTSAIPPTSPRLPSPPPPVEDLSDPASPNLLPSSPGRPPTPSKNEPTRRIRKGTKAIDITAPPIIPLADLDSAFQLQEHLSAVLAAITNPPGLSHSVPLTRKDCERIATPPEGVDEWLWCYELTRRLTRDLNSLIIGLLVDNCTKQSCPEMRASSWQYLCAVHDPPQSCCAMDYSTHTLDHAATTLCSTKHFPSRLSLNQNGTKQLSSIFRRLYRIFAHAWFSHRNVFWEVENEFGLYIFFKTVSERFSLIPDDNLTIPTTAEGGYDGSASDDDDFSRRTTRNKSAESDDSDDDDDDVEQDDFDEEGRNLNDVHKTSAAMAREELPNIDNLQLSNGFGLTRGDFSDDGDTAGESYKDGMGMLKEDFPLFVFQETDPQSLTEEEKIEMHAGGPPHVLSTVGNMFPPVDESSGDGERINVKLDLEAEPLNKKNDE